MQQALVERHNAALILAEKFFLPPPTAAEPPLTTLFQLARRVFQTELELTDKPAERVAILNRQLTLARQMEAHDLALQENRVVLPNGEIELMRLYRADAEVQLLRAKAHASKSSP